MALMRRQSLVKFDAPLCETIVDTPKPAGREVLVRIERCGLCHSDLHIQDGYADLGGGKKLDTTRGMKLPFTLGHENAGWVHEVGAGVTSVRKGDAVLVYGPWGCGTCRPCRLGRENYCERAASIAPYWENALHSLRGVPHVIDIRNLGLVGGIELEPRAGAPGARAFEVFVECFNRGKDGTMVVDAEYLEVVIVRR